jgi:hypothetical protein
MSVDVTLRRARPWDASSAEPRGLARERVEAAASILASAILLGSAEGRVCADERVTLGRGPGQG